MRLPRTYLTESQSMTMLEKLVVPEVRELIEVGDLDTLREVLNRWLPADIADLLGDLSSTEDVVAFQCLLPELAARTFEYLPAVAQEELLHIFPEPELSGILNELAPPDRRAPVRTPHAEKPLAFRHAQENRRPDESS